MISEFVSNLNLRIPEELRHKLEDLAAVHDTTLSQICRELLHRSTKEEFESK